jgi:heme/copper-type cytochrome/quinol oxidase subunit 2
MSSFFAAGLFWTSVACCAVAQIYIIRSVRSVREQAPSATVPRSRESVELMWAILPAVALAVVLFFTWRAIERESQAPHVVVGSIR